MIKEFMKHAKFNLVVINHELFFHNGVSDSSYVNDTKFYKKQMKQLISY